MSHESDGPWNEQGNPEVENPATKATRLFENLGSLLKDELAEYGGGEAFLRWIRSEDDAQTGDQSTV